MMGIRAANPALNLKKALTCLPKIEADHNISIIAIGKAARSMAEVALDTFAHDSIKHAIAITNHENAIPHQSIDVRGCGHPIPDEDGLKAGQDLSTILQRLDDDDIVLCLISGGGSALLPSPPPPLSLEEKIIINKLLLDAGLNITQMNHIRQQFSSLKGGELVRLAYPAKVYAFLLSDVPGDDIRIIASGLTAPPIGTATTARLLLERYHLWQHLPYSAQDYLLKKEDSSETPAPFPSVQNQLVGSNIMSIDAVSKALTDKYDCEINNDWLSGDVDELARFFVSKLISAPKNNPYAYISGGEPSVVIRGNGLGGRNQELALRVAWHAKDKPIEHPWVFLSGGTDGRDGPTDAAGAITNNRSISKLHELGIDADNLLNNNDSYHGLQALNSLIITGATGTNVADIHILLTCPFLLDQ